MVTTPEFYRTARPVADMLVKHDNAINQELDKHRPADTMLCQFELNSYNHEAAKLINMMQDDRYDVHRGDQTKRVEHAYGKLITALKGGSAKAKKTPFARHKVASGNRRR